MSILKPYIAVLLSGLCISSPSFAQVLNIDPATVEAQAWIILDPQSHQTIASYNAQQMRAPASLTKLMVGYLTLKALNNNKIQLDQIITVPEIVNTVAPDESRLKLHPNDQISIKDLLASLIIMSANDAALTLGVHIAGDLPNFIALMNQTAKELGMLNTHFSNASGITMQDHYSSAEDLALLAQAIVSQTPDYLGYSKQQSFQRGDIYHEATNILLRKDPSVDGLKTGYTQAAGYNLALTAQRLDPNLQQQRRLVVIVMGTKSKQKRADVAETLMNIAFNYTQTKQLLNQDSTIARLPIFNGKSLFYEVKMQRNETYNTVSLLDNTLALDAKKFDHSQQRFILDPKLKTTLEPMQTPHHLHYEIQLNQKVLTAPIQQNDVTLAHVQVSQFGNPLYNLEVKNDLHLEEASVWQKLLTWFKSWFAYWQEPAAQAVIYPIPS